MEKKKTVIDNTAATQPAPLPPLRFTYNVVLGCDPEFFFSSNGEIIGSEKVLSEKGLKYDPIKDKTGPDGAHTAPRDAESKFIVDGVQAELNPRPNTCRANLGNEIGACFRKLYAELSKGGKKVGVDFKPLVNISQKELDTLSEKSKVFGCAPSTNIYSKPEEAKIKVDPKKYLKRSAGGHIHLGWNAGYWGGAINSPEMKKTLQNPEVLVPILDLIVANTCVLLDRNEGNVERRKNYGRVGEYRQKDYGIEYRTLSNFWLRSYQLMSLVTGLCRLACHIVEQSTETTNYVKALTDAVPQEDVVKAVQENDFDLAYQNFKKIEKILCDAVGKYRYSNYPISSSYINEFHHFIKRGIDHWFSTDPLQHWMTLPEGHGTGFESFLGYTVKNDLNNFKTTAIDLNKDEKVVAVA